MSNPYLDWLATQYPKQTPAFGIRKGHTIDGKTVKHKSEWQTAMDGYRVAVTFTDGTTGDYSTGDMVTVGIDLEVERY